MTSRTLKIGPISPAAEGPLYEQIVAGVKREVAASRLLPGAALPSVRALAAELLVSVITVKRAYEELERGGIIFSRQGLGTFIADAGAEETRRSGCDAARQHLRDAARAAREAGLSEKDLLDLLRKEF
ncbi:MAG TPA: GntR family transcriptional regulator [Rhizomicrobium sp.]|jgi:GntR family transcriptional regulator|nr:GntR family transcriptional regulator [Rhizomicrobium sp.]